MTENKLFKEPKTFFQEKINSIVRTERKVLLVEPLIRQAFYQEQLKVSPNNISKTMELYNFLGLDKFADFLAIFEGESFKLPKLDSFKKAVQIAVDTAQQQENNPKSIAETSSFEVSKKILKTLEEKEING